MAAPLILRIIGDATSYFKTADTVVATNTKMGQSALAMGSDFAKAAEAQVAAGTKAIQVQRAMVAELTAAQAKTIAGSDEQIAATVALESAQSKLNRTLGISSAGFGATSRGAQDAERDLSKMTRGALAGTGVISSLGRSLAFASGGFLAVAGGATLLVRSITDAEDLAKAQDSLAVAIQHTGGNLAELEPVYAATAKSAAQFGISQADATAGLAKATTLTGNAAAAQRAYQEALVISKATGIDFNSVLTATSKAQEGITTSLRRYGILVTSTETGTDQLAQVMKRFGGQATANTTSVQVLEAELANAGATIGTVLLPTFTRLTSEFSDWLSRMEESGRLQRDANDGFTIMGDSFRTLGFAIKVVDDATGSFAHTVEILIALELGNKMLGWASALRVLAGEWGIVGAAATTAGEAQVAAVATSGAAGAGGAAEAGAGGVGGLFAGGLLGSVAGSKVRGFFASRAAASEIGGFGAEGEAAVGVSATGIGALGVAALLASDALAGLAKKVNDAAGGGSTGRSIISGIEGALTGGIFGNSRVGKDALTAGIYEFFRSSPPAPPVNTPQQNQQLLGISTAQLFGANPATAEFGAAKPMETFWKTFTLTFKEQMAQAQAALTKSNADDVAAAKQVVARIKTELAEGNIHGPALFQALQLEANALSTIWSAEAAAAQKRAAAAAAAKAKIQAQIENSIDPIRLEVLLSKAQATSNQTDIVKTLKDMRDAAENALKTENLTLKQQKEAWDQIASLNQQIKAASTTAVATFTAPALLQFALAKDQALGTDQTSDLMKLKRAILKFIATHKKNIAAETDAYNQLAQVNQELGATAQSALGAYKELNTAQLTKGLGLTAAQQAKLRGRLSQRGPGGTVPRHGVGAYGYDIDSHSGRPIHVHTRIDIDGKKVASNTTRHQQKRRSRSGSQRRGPNAGSDG